MHMGILTGGGDCPGLNAVIRAATKTLLSRGVEVLGFKDGYRGIYEKNYPSAGQGGGIRPLAPGRHHPGQQQPR